MSFKYKIIEDEKNTELESVDEADEEFFKETPEESKKEEAAHTDEESKDKEEQDKPAEREDVFDIYEPKHPILKIGDLIVSADSEGKPVLNVSERLMIEFSI